MKTIKLFLIAIVLLGITTTSCKKDKIKGCTNKSATNYKSSAEEDDGSCTYTGQVTFWYNSNGTAATVYIDGKYGNITAYYDTYNPTCGSSGCATFTLPVGTYNYTASSSWSNWSGSVAVTANGCKLVLLQ